MTQSAVWCGRTPKTAPRLAGEGHGASPGRLGGISGRGRPASTFGVLLALCCLAACTRLGPDFARPPTEVETRYAEGADDRLSDATANYRDWWQVFNDPVLNKLMTVAYEQNLPLRSAGLRVLEARAQLGIAVGNWYPQVQQATGSFTANQSSAGSVGNAQNPTGSSFYYNQVQAAGAAAWEMDFWGKFRRAIESADMNLLASIAAYDSVLVSLTGDVASRYVAIRTSEERLRIARENVELQRESLKIAQARFQGGATSERDVQQALTQLNATEARIPQLESDLQKTRHALSILLGLPPAKLAPLLQGESAIPTAPSQVAVGIPADLLRRRPDVRNAEYQAAAQCAQIGVAKAELYPAFSLTGNFGVISTDVGTASLADVFAWNNRFLTVGPSIQWNILNYGRLTNNVRLQDARFQELLVNYQNVVLQAQQEVEDGLVSFLKAQDRVAYLKQSVEAAHRTVELATVQYREGATDYTTVLTAQQALLDQEDSLATTQGDIPLGLIATYRALGGGWEIREGNDIIPPDIKKAMAERTNWGGLLGPRIIPPPPAERLDALPPKPDW